MFEMFDKIFAQVMMELGRKGWWELADSSAYEEVYIPRLAAAMGISVAELEAMPEFQLYDREMTEEL